MARRTLLASQSASAHGHVVRMHLHDGLLRDAGLGGRPDWSMPIGMLWWHGRLAVTVNI